MRKMPIKTRVIELTGEWEGWQCTVRTNPAISIFGDIASGEFEAIARAMSKIIIAWNFVDEEGLDLPKPSLETVSELPAELVTAVANRYIEELTKLPPA